MATVLCVFMTAACFGAQEEQMAPYTIEGSRTVVFGPVTLQAGGTKAALDQAQRVVVPPVEPVTVKAEAHARLPVFNPKARGYAKGAKLDGVRTQECSATGLLVPESVRAKAAPGATAAFEQGKDYGIDLYWGTFGRLEDGAISPEDTVYFDYVYVPCRLDSVVWDEANGLQLILGEPSVGITLPPEIPSGMVHAANIYQHGVTPALTDENVYPIDFGLAPYEPEPVAEKLLPKTLAKLRNGEEVTIVAWGDSVTNGGGVGQDHRQDWYQYQFEALLEERYPQAGVTMLTAAWGGRSSRAYLDAPPDNPQNFQREVIETNPDLVTIEFVNDAYLSGEQFEKQYEEILDKITATGAEIAFITPHYVRPDWMGVETMKVDEDPRQYVKDLRAFAAKHGVALADASVLWGRLWREGIPYITLQGNSINHPGVRGHAMFARALIGLFPPE